MTDLTAFQAQAASVAVKKLLYDSLFSIYDMDKIAKLIGVQIGGKDYEALSSLHCVSWGDMGPELRQQAREKICEMLGLSVPIEGSATTVNDETQSKSSTTVNYEAQTKPSSKFKLPFWK